MTAVALLIAAVLIVTGAVAAAGTAVPPSRSVAAVAAGAGLLVEANSWSLTASTTAESLALAGRPLCLALLGIVVLGWRPAMAVALAGGVLAGPVTQLLDDPFYDTSCVGRCDPNPLAVVPAPQLADVARVVGLCLLLVGLLAPARRGDRRALVVACGLGLGLAMSAVWGDRSALTFIAAGAGTVLGADLARAGTISARLSDAVVMLATTDHPEHVLGQALGGREVWLGFQVRNVGLVDRDGRPLPAPPEDWSVVEITGSGGPIAQLRLDLTGVSPVALVAALRGPARLALENARLAAEAAVRSDEIRESARRLIELGERGRRELERDLHDGAQRHVLTLGLALRADQRLPVSVREAAGRSVASVLGELRDVAHGIRPPQLDTGGLARGLAVLADRSSVPLAAGPFPAGLADSAAEACYRLVEDVLRTAGGPVSASVLEAADGAWTLAVDSAEGGALPRDSADRFRALGGDVHSSEAGQGWHHLAWLPTTL